MGGCEFISCSLFVRFGGPEVLEVESNVKLPEIQDDQVLVRVMYAGVNPVETYIREGQYSRLPDLPYTPGSDAAGYIHQVGKDVTNLKVEAQSRKISLY